MNMFTTTTYTNPADIQKVLASLGNDVKKAPLQATSNSSSSTIDSYATALTSGTQSPKAAPSPLLAAQIALPAQTNKEIKSLTKEPLVSSLITQTAKLGLGSKIVGGLKSLLNTLSAFAADVKSGVKNMAYKVADFAKSMVSKKDNTVTLDDGLKDETSPLVSKED
jgi:hypothetical protein